MQHMQTPSSRPNIWIPAAVIEYPGWYKPIEIMFNGAVMARQRTAPNPQSYFYCVSGDSPYVMDGEVQEWYK